MLALAAALSTMGTGLLAGPAHAAPTPSPNMSSSSTSASASSSSGDGPGRKQAPRPPAAADPNDQDAVDSLWQQLLHTLGLGDDDSTHGAKDEPTDEDPADKDSASTPPASAAQPTATADSTANRQAMPTTAPAGWSQVLADDFTTPTALGTFPGPAYSSRWGGYDGFTDTSGVGTYTPDRVVSVSDGVMDLHLHTEDGKALTAAPVPQVDGRWGGWTYGRYSVRFRADAVAGYKTAWLLWPDSDDWNDGEIDFPEGDLDGSISAFVHQPGAPSSNALAVDTGAAFTDWHTATTEWLPDGVTFFLDGEQVGHTHVSPSTPMHLVLQTETSGQPSAAAAGHVQIDWITLARRD
jgi:beta-glucanase (GH16 family)